MERQQNIRQAAIRRVGANFTLSGLPIEQNTNGGSIIMMGGGPTICACGAEVPGSGICSCGR
jgi:hypothetical protein